MKKLFDLFVEIRAVRDSDWPSRRLLQLRNSQSNGKQLRHCCGSCEVGDLNSDWLEQHSVFSEHMVVSL